MQKVTPGRAHMRLLAFAARKAGTCPFQTQIVFQLTPPQAEDKQASLAQH